MEVGRCKGGDMKFGTFVGVNHTDRKVVLNSHPMVMEEFMESNGIFDPKDVVGPFETILLDNGTVSYPTTQDEWDRLHPLALKEAKGYRYAVAQKLAGDPKTATMARNTNLFEPRGPIAGDF